MIMLLVGFVVALVGLTVAFAAVSYVLLGVIIVACEIVDAIKDRL